MRPFGLILSEEWNDLDEKVWVKKKNAKHSFRVILGEKASWLGSPSYLMSCGDKVWVSLIGLTSYINYSPSLVVK